MRPFYRIMRFVSQIAGVLFFRLRVFGVDRVPREGGVLLVSNHQSYLDPALVTLALPREGNYMARDTLFRNPLFRRFIDALNTFPVRRNTGDVGAIKEVMRRLREGRLVVVFPEGTRTRDGAIGPLHAGALMVAIRTGCPIVPVAVQGAFEVWPRGRALPRLSAISVAYGHPIRLSEEEEEVSILHDRVRTALLALQGSLSGLTRHRPCVGSYGTCRKCAAPKAP